jgi:hypothetical protein
LEFLSHFDRQCSVIWKNIQYNLFYEEMKQTVGEKAGMGMLGISASRK